MGGLASRAEVKEFKIIMLGMDSSGKTTMLHRMKNDSVTTTIPTIGMTVEELKVKNLRIISWDVGGRCKMRPLYRHFMKDADAIIIVVDASDMEWSGAALDEIEQLESYDAPPSSPIFVAANKQDLLSALSPDKIRIQLEERCRKTREVPQVMGTVATTGDGVFELLDCITRSVKISRDDSSLKLDTKIGDAPKRVSGPLQMAALKVKSLLKLGNSV